MGCTIIGCGKKLPNLEISNDDMSKLVDTSDEWISTRTGIRTRRVCVKETNADLAEQAARQALGWDSAGRSSRRIAPEDIDLIIYSTVTPDAWLPTGAATIRRRLGLVNAAAMDINAACTGFIYGLTVAESMMAAAAPGTPGAAGRNPIRRALVIGSERLSRITNWQDRNTCVLFGDGAGAAVVEWNAEKPGILSWFIRNDDDTDNALTLMNRFDTPIAFTEAGVSLEALEMADPSVEAIDTEFGQPERDAAAPHQVLHMQGQKVFKFATHAMPDAVEEVLRRAGLTIDDVKLIVPHQANLRIIKYAAKRMNLPLERFQISIAHRGNSSSACIPMTLCDAYEQGNIKPGDNVVLVGFGGGFTSGAVLFQA